MYRGQGSSNRTIKCRLEGCEIIVRLQQAGLTSLRRGVACAR